MKIKTNAHTVGPNSIMPRRGCPGRHGWYHDQDDFLHLLLLELFGLVLLGLPFFGCSRTIVLERFFTNGHEDRKVPGQICWSSNQRSLYFGLPGLSRIGERHNLEVPPLDLWRPLGLGKFAGLPALD